jgi:hypothetical protein
MHAACQASIATASALSPLMAVASGGLEPTYLLVISEMPLPVGHDASGEDGI